MNVKVTKFRPVDRKYIVADTWLDALRKYKHGLSAMTLHPDNHMLFIDMETDHVILVEKE